MGAWRGVETMLALGGAASPNGVFTARPKAADPPTTGNSIVVLSRSTVSSVPGCGQRVNSRSLEKIISPIR